jgi:hypothetical protein
MELKEIRTLIRDKMFSLGYTEWVKSSLDVDVPDTILENSFRVVVVAGVSEPLNMHVLKIKNDVQLTIWKKGFANEVEAQDMGLETVENILCLFLKPDFRTLPSFRRLDFSGYKISPLSDDNGHVAKIEMNFEVEVMLGVTDDVL